MNILNLDSPDFILEMLNHVYEMYLALFLGSPKLGSKKEKNSEYFIELNYYKTLRSCSKLKLEKDVKLMS